MESIIREIPAANSIGYGAGDDDAFYVVEQLLEGVSRFDSAWAVIPGWMLTQMRRDPRYRNNTISISQWDLDYAMGGTSTGPTALCRVREAG